MFDSVARREIDNLIPNIPPPSDPKMSESNLSILNEENIKRVNEIKFLARNSNALLAEDDETRSAGRNEQRENDKSESSEDDSNNIERTKASWNRSRVTSSHTPQTSMTRGSDLLSAKDIITVEILNGEDDIGVEESIRNVKRAKQRCSQSDLLLDFILTDKITRNALFALCRRTVTTNYSHH